MCVYSLGSLTFAVASDASWFGTSAASELGVAKSLVHFCLPLSFELYSCMIYIVEALPYYLFLGLFLVLGLPVFGFSATPFLVRAEATPSARFKAFGSETLVMSQMRRPAMLWLAAVLSNKSTSLYLTDKYP